ncbi:aldehyde dehydrogenase (NADP(+)) [Tenacibaculum finnmarkense]|uniref:Aldehyde dehydrogenase family protein n=1 Tax=Tenacibaculum finnmarkense genomovar finnmarkense TaxID=1458503 RepID=A0AAP1RGF4_9FLAO|nr:aldehyde dehydrogenase (NADP(+)) [Tenacibaculum finnmarkense]MBE7653197.1 aldehyde dehydrogenase family protein [Tenacibaculum finnmarkense genomovar finnmarkense]MBE7695433.1 aldehyde dehydrogenase family protein [Tenacibaculum finnmarkense genomovar finnmarkense]MCD8427565.1 aldehyde dehydrogenase (NADP(+)) [Tenacibaculum finnmarkense genomovar finnmarkense]MCG8731401.1 aldehyde dehydrogenase (NADP(+)) [Tenacibaculum finnmarkense]MCG8751950.1 aldehyde dehydrogenase (NADP(+)) [Tenacibaculu
MITGKNYIGNQLKASGTTTHKTVNPKLNMQNPTDFYQATLEEVNQAVVLADSAFKVYRKVSGEKRAEFLNAIADEILALDTELIDMYMSESGLPEGRAQGERGRTVGQLRAFADLVAKDQWRNVTIDQAIPTRQPLPKSDLRKTSIPLGPVVVFAASNFPLAFSTAGGDTASALASGCPVIVKSHAMHSGTGELVASAIIKAAEKTGMPNGVFSNITGSGRVVGSALVKHPKVKAVGFTGSIAGGRALYNLGAQRDEPIPVFAEMGSINPVVVLPNVIKNKAAETASTYAGSITVGTGQFCTNPGLLLTIAGADTDAFVKDLAEKTVAIAPQCMLHPNIKDGFVSNAEVVSSQPGVQVVGQITATVEANFAASTICAVSGAEFLANPKMHTEVFGPFSLVVKAKDQAELLDVIDHLDGQLTGTVLAEKEDFDALPAVADALQAKVGRIIFNGVPTGVEVCESMTHGGPYPASSDSRFTAVGLGAIKRWVRPFSFQDWPTELLPTELRN